jgi:Fe-Mn family superoxide dismutase
MESKPIYTPLEYKANDYSGLKGLHGITDEQIEVHLKLYNGYVNRTNALLAKLAKLANDGQHADSSYQELKRRAGWEWNGMRLHEYYFDNLGANAAPHPRRQPVRRPRRQPVRQRGRVEGRPDGHRQDAGRRLGDHLPRPASTARSGTTGSTSTRSATPPAPSPLLVLDVWEHAFSVYRKPTDRPAYLEDFFANVCWDTVGQAPRRRRRRSLIGPSTAGRSSRSRPASRLIT